MLIIKSKYKKKRGGSLKAVLKKSLQNILLGTLNGAAKSLKRKHDSIINGKGIIYI